MSERVRVLVADDHRMIRHALEESLSRRYDVIPGASTLREIDDAFRRGGFDVAVLDMSWGREGPVTPHLPRWYKCQPAVRVIILTALDEYYLGKAFLEGGAHGFLGKRSDFSEILTAVDAVFRGEIYFGSDLKPPPKRAASASGEGLPAIALHILELLAYGWSRKEIAKALNLSVKGVDYHIGTIRSVYGIAPWDRPNWPELFAKSTEGPIEGMGPY